MGAYAESAGFTKALEGNLGPVQEAVKHLATAATNLAAGDVKAASAEFGDSAWVNDFKKATEKISNDQDSRSRIKPLFDDVQNFKKALDRSQVQPAKTAFVDTVGSLKAWAAAAQVDTLLNV